MFNPRFSFNVRVSIIPPPPGDRPRDTPMTWATLVDFEPRQRWPYRYA